MLKCVLFGAVLIAAVGAFALAHGAAEYRIACSCLIVGDHGTREMTPQERRSRFTEATVAAAPIGAKAVGLLLAPLWFAAWVLRSAPCPVGYVVGGGCGCVCGAALAIAVHVAVGVWGASLFHPAVAAAVVLTVGLVAVERRARGTGPAAAPGPAT